MKALAEKQVRTYDTEGFTLIELLVVLFIIALLSSVGLFLYNSAIDKANIARAEGDLLNFRKAISAMSADMGKWPNGCPIGHTIVGNEDGTTNEIPISDVAATTDPLNPVLPNLPNGDPNNPNGSAPAALTVPPPRGTGSGENCHWYLADRPELDAQNPRPAKWRGPYINSAPLDPWGHPYWFDNDYNIRYNCCVGPSCPASSTDPHYHSSGDTYVTTAIVSEGPDGNNLPPNVGGGGANNNVVSSDCDDIYLELPNDHPHP